MFLGTADERDKTLSISMKKSLWLSRLVIGGAALIATGLAAHAQAVGDAGNLPARKFMQV